MSINLESLKKAVGNISTPAPTTKPLASGGSMGGDVGYLIQLLGRSLLGAIAWRFFSSFLKSSGFSWLTNAFWTFFVAVAFCYLSDTKLRFLSTYQRDLVLGIIGTPFLDWVLRFVR